MEIFYLVTFFIFGLLMGSFFTVVGLRLPRREEFVANRSYCDICHHELSFKDMVPLVSFLFLRGRCRYCKAKINPLSSYMELFTGVLFALSYFVFGFSYELLIALGIVSMLVIVSVSDITYLIIPDELLIFFSGYFLIVRCLAFGVVSALVGILSGLALFGVMYGIMLLGNFLFKKESLGGGDIKMMFVFGLIINPILGLFVIFIASVLALPVSIFILLKNHENLIPFGPFLLIGFTLIYFMDIDLNMVIEFIRSI